MNKKFKIIGMISIPLIIAVLLINNDSRGFIFKITSLFSTVDPEPVKEYILSFGPLAVIVSFLLMVFQSLAAPLPAFLITFANAAVFGWGFGAVLSWASSMAGAAACFGIAKLYGRDTVAKLTGKTALKSVDDFFEKFGGKSIFVARLLPFMPFDIVSYAAGLTSMKFWPFFLATGLGQLPATIVYSYAGKMLGGGARTFVYGLFIVFALAALTSIIKSIYDQRSVVDDKSAIAIKRGAKK
ncbi:MAG: TVP38/TMEM64 family protein [Clostridiaceae bacterium]